jgi:mRNA-degrading endonuclease YafQ of YafQ-DinJ toxin-antitoxin module
MKVLFSADFKEALEKHSSIKSAVRKKVDMIIQEPLALGEPLKGNFRGSYSCSVRKSFLIIYLYCRACRKKKDQEIVLCADCQECPDETIKFILLGPHDEAYARR